MFSARKLVNVFSRITLVEQLADVINATTDYGPNCHKLYQGVPGFLHQVRQEDEECLYLNVWKPTTIIEPVVATMVRINGGGFAIGFAIGSGADPYHDGAVLAREQDVVVLTLKYRIEVLGFLPQDDSDFGGMNGLYDQITALHWVQRKHCSVRR